MATIFEGSSSSESADDPASTSVAAGAYGLDPLSRLGRGLSSGTGPSCFVQETNAMTDGDYQAPVPPDEQINPSPSYPQAPPLPGGPSSSSDPMMQPEQATVPSEPQPDAGTPNPYPQSEQPQPGDGGQGAGGSTAAQQPDPWTITDVPADAPDETEQAQENQGPHEPPLP